MGLSPGIWTAEKFRSSCATLSGIMFIHRTFNAGCGDRGAWPWRKPAHL